MKLGGHLNIPKLIDDGYSANSAPLPARGRWLEDPILIARSTYFITVPRERTVVSATTKMMKMP